ncbi:MAG: OB-fold domain-containing protein [Marmoricola sp.]
MIAFVRGVVAEIGLSSAVIEVGGIELDVQCTPQTLSQLRVGLGAVVPTSMVVREDSLTLFGFATDDEKQSFRAVANREWGRPQGGPGHARGPHARGDQTSYHHRRCQGADPGSGRGT